MPAIKLICRLEFPFSLFTCALRSAVDPERHYAGLTANVVERVAAHNAGQSVHTANKRPWTPIVSMEFREEQLARRFEHYLKSGSGRAFAKRHFAWNIRPGLERGQRPAKRM